MSDASRQVLDVGALASAIEVVARHRKISMRNVAAETGLSSSTLTRLTRGQKPDADALVTLLAWLNADAAAFAVPRTSRDASEAGDANREMRVSLRGDARETTETGEPS